VDIVPFHDPGGINRADQGGIAPDRPCTGPTTCCRCAPATGRWCISALNLPAEVLRLVYSENARTLIPGLQR
jgi:hypothetical protein